MALQQPLNQQSTLPPAQPVYILRGHAAQIHAVHFLPDNLRLLTGDAEGWIVLWSLPIRRPLAVWKAHKEPILGLGSWGNDKIITHGRDSKLYVWQLRAEDEATFSTTLPIDDAVSERKQPWLIHSLTVNTLNFCSFAMCADGTQSHSTDILIATPGVSDGSTNITALPSEQRFATIPSPPGLKTGMTMALALTYTAQRSSLRLLAGYESGHIAVWERGPNTSTTRWTAIYTTKQHSQPILSLAPTPDGSCFFTSSADAIIARYSMPEAGGACEEKVLQTKHAGQQSISVRSDGKIFSTAGWDGRIRVYSVKTLKELAVLKWHKEGCYATAFARIHESAATDDAGGKAEEEGDLVKRDLTVSEQRVEKARRTHWLAAGSKDGKVSLWDIY